MAEIDSITRTFTLGTDGVTYFEVTTITYDNEEQEVIKTLIGPAAQLGNHYADDFINKARQMADNAKGAALNEKRLTELDTDETEIFNITGVSPKDTIQARYETELLTPGWTIDDGGGPLSLVFTINAQNNLRYAVNGGATASAEYLHGVIRLNNYPTTGILSTFYATANYNRYGSLPGGKVIIKRP